MNFKTISQLTNQLSRDKFENLLNQSEMKQAIHALEKLCFDFMKILLNEQLVRSLNIPEKEIEYFQIVIKKLVNSFLQNGNADLLLQDALSSFQKLNPPKVTANAQQNQGSKRETNQNHQFLSVGQNRSQSTLVQNSRANHAHHLSSQKPGLQQSRSGSFNKLPESQQILNSPNVQMFDHKQNSQRKRKQRFEISSSDDDETEDNNHRHLELQNQTQDDDEDEDALNAPELLGMTNSLKEETRIQDLSPALGPSGRNLKDTMYSRMTKKELIGIIQKQKNFMKEMNTQHNEHIDQIESMRYGYLKELSNLRDQVINKELRGKRFEYIEVHFFEPTDTLNEEMCFVLNKKLEQMKELYEGSLQRMQLTNHNLQRQIDLFLKLGEDGNIGIRFDEMDADSVIRKLNKIEKNPRIIWKAFDEYYGYGFFFDVLEMEFGITPETHHKLIERFDQEISQYKTVAVGQISSITEKNQSEIDRLRKELEDKNLEFGMIKQRHLVDMDRMKKDITEAMEVKCQGMLAAQFRKFDEEKAEFFEQIRELEQAAGDYKKVKREFDLNMLFTRWMFIAKIRSIRALGNIELKAQAATEAEKQMHDRDFQLLMTKNPNLNLKEELQDAKNEITELCQQISDLQYSSFSLKKDRDYYHDKLQEVQLEADKLKQDYEEAKQNVKIFKDEYHTYRTNFESSQKYVKTLETEVMQLKQKITRLNEIAEQFMQNTEQVESAFSVAATGSQKAINDLNINFVQKIDEMYHEKMKDKSTLTTLFGLNKTIDKRDDDEKLPTIPKGIQVSVETANFEIQTDKEEKASVAPGMEEIMKMLSGVGDMEGHSKEQILQNILSQLGAGGHSMGDYEVEMDGGRQSRVGSFRGKRGGRGIRGRMRGRGNLNSSHNKGSYLSIPGSMNMTHDIGEEGEGFYVSIGKNSMMAPQLRKLSQGRRGRGGARGGKRLRDSNADIDGVLSQYKQGISQTESQPNLETHHNESVNIIGGGDKGNQAGEGHQNEDYGEENFDQYDENYFYGQEDEYYGEEQDEWERGSGLMDALDGDPDLKRQISEEVNRQHQLELKMEHVNINSKEIQYSKASSRVSDTDYQKSFITSTKIGGDKNKVKSRVGIVAPCSAIQTKRDSDQNTPSNNQYTPYKIVPFTLRNMERILHRGFNLDKKEKCIQTEKVNWYQIMLEEHHNNGLTQIFESMDHQIQAIQQISHKEEPKFASRKSELKYQTQREITQASPSNENGTISTNSGQTVSKTLASRLLTASARQQNTSLMQSSIAGQVGLLKQSQLMKRAHNLRSNSMIEGSAYSEYTHELVNLKIEGQKKLKPGQITDDIQQQLSNNQIQKVSENNKEIQSSKVESKTQNVHTEELAQVSLAEKKQEYIVSRRKVRGYSSNIMRPKSQLSQPRKSVNVSAHYPQFILDPTDVQFQNVHLSNFNFNQNSVQLDEKSLKNPQVSQGLNPTASMQDHGIINDGVSEYDLMMGPTKNQNFFNEATFHHNPSHNQSLAQPQIGEKGHHSLASLGTTAAASKGPNSLYQQNQLLMNNPNLQNGFQRPLTSKLRSITAYKLKRKLNSHSQSMVQERGIYQGQANHNGIGGHILNNYGSGASSSFNQSMELYIDTVKKN